MEFKTTLGCHKLFISLLMSFMTFTTHAQSILLGDINLDENVNVTDVTTLVDIVLNDTPIYIEPTSVGEVKEGMMEYKKSDNTMVFGHLYKDRKIGITIGPGGANNLLDFRNIFFYDTASGISSPSNVSYFIKSVGDMHAPFKFRSDDGTEQVSFTGGNHAYSNGVVKTAILESVTFYVDGRKITADTELGICRNIKIIWSNLVKAGNAYAAGDDYALRETHTMYYDGVRFEEYIDLQPIVDIKMGVWYGLQLMPVVGQKFVHFANAKNRALYDVSADRKSGDKTCNKVIAGNDTCLISMSIDNSFDIGDRRYATSDVTHGGKYIASTGKSYFTIIFNNGYTVSMAANTHYWLHGYYEIGDNTNFIIGNE